MPMSQATLSAKIKTELEGVFGTADDPATLQKFADGMAKAIYDEITQNAVATGADPQGGTVTSTIS